MMYGLFSEWNRGEGSSLVTIFQEFPVYVTLTFNAKLITLYAT